MRRTAFFVPCTLCKPPQPRLYATRCSPVAQSVEQAAVNRWVAGSSPARGANENNDLNHPTTPPLSVSADLVENLVTLGLLRRPFALPIWPRARPLAAHGHSASSSPATHGPWLPEPVRATARRAAFGSQRCGADHAAEIRQRSELGGGPRHGRVPSASSGSQRL